jgi:hypothetical protein
VAEVSAIRLINVLLFAVLEAAVVVVSGAASGSTVSVGCASVVVDVLGLPVASG